ncbi:hypothetical protein CR62_04940 [Serratia grimesii]|uniref:Uncharacterized protein n=1 Tax=Serratia grimesii TaxID=82995 RepID=A0ABR4U8U0_9GAMM|nr:hypothetical protein CR62_04940 [Serratia grimesii]
MWASGSIVGVRAKSYGVFLSQSAIRVERICAVIGLYTSSVFQPQGNDIHNIQLVLFVQCLALWNIMPFGQAAAATGGCGVLGDKYRMSSHGRLFAVIFWKGCGKSLFDKVSCMTEDQRQAFGFKIKLVFDVKTELGAERGTL